MWHDSEGAVDRRPNVCCSLRPPIILQRGLVAPRPMIFRNGPNVRSGVRLRHTVNSIFHAAVGCSKRSTSTEGVVVIFLSTRPRQSNRHSSPRSTRHAGRESRTSLRSNPLTQAHAHHVTQAQAHSAQPKRSYREERARTEFRNDVGRGQVVSVGSSRNHQYIHMHGTIGPFFGRSRF